MNDVKELMKKAGLKVTAGDYMMPTDLVSFSNYAFFKGLSHKDAMYGLAHNRTATLKAIFGSSEELEALEAELKLKAEAKQAAAAEKAASKEAADLAALEELAQAEEAARLQAEQEAEETARLQAEQEAEDLASIEAEEAAQVQAEPGANQPEAEVVDAQPEATETPAITEGE